MSDTSHRVIVVGSGPAGAVAAHVLVRKGIPVTLIESGARFQSGLLIRAMGKNLLQQAPPLPNSKDYVPTGDPETKLFVNLAPGGLSNQWSGAVPRFAPGDFTEGERLHERYRWPISYDDLKPYYEAVERMLSITAGMQDVNNLPVGHPAYFTRLPSDWLAVAQHAHRRGQGMTTLPLAHGNRWMLVRRGTAFNSYSELIAPLLKFPNFKLQVGYHALRLEWSPIQKRVQAVICQSRMNASQHRLAAAAVVVACGPIRSTKLLLDSACPDFPNGLGNAAGLLGRYLHDHPRERWVFHTDRPVSLLNPPLYLTRLPYSCSPPLIATGWNLGTGSLADRAKSIAGMKSTSVGVQVFGTMIPTEKHSIMPAPDLYDEFGTPQMEINLSYGRDTKESLHRAREQLLSLMDEAGYQCTMGAVHRTAIPGDSIHYGGSVRMHSTRTYGVLDASNRVYDVPNVIVCDASCFPTGPEKNPTLTVMAIAARAADKLLFDLKRC